MKISYPVKSVQIIQPFGFDNFMHKERGSFYTLFGDKHPGVDFELEENTPVYASFEGIVVRNEFHKGMGNVVSVRNGNIVALYAHLNASKVRLGFIVNTGDLVGLSGNTGAATSNAHLHFELRDISKKVLKDMVFEPPFEKNAPNHLETFVYSVNNVNTLKTLKSLSKLYFGTESYVEKLKSINKLNVEDDETLQDGLLVTIPNY